MEERLRALENKLDEKLIELKKSEIQIYEILQKSLCEIAHKMCQLQPDDDIFPILKKKHSELCKLMVTHKKNLSEIGISIT
jgi:hypothetical protein